MFCRFPLSTPGSPVLFWHFSSASPKWVIYFYERTFHALFTACIWRFRRGSKQPNGKASFNQFCVFIIANCIILKFYFSLWKISCAVFSNQTASIQQERDSKFARNSFVCTLVVKREQTVLSGCRSKIDKRKELFLPQEPLEPVGKSIENETNKETFEWC